MSPQEESGVCTRCGAPMAMRPEGRYPVALQISFGASFIAFLVVIDRFSLNRWVLISWCALQIILGVALVRGRIRAGRRVYRCVRCDRGIR